MLSPVFSRTIFVSLAAHAGEMIRQLRVLCCQFSNTFF
jgi:hypothetical protein